MSGGEQPQIIWHDDCPGQYRVIGPKYWTTRGKATFKESDWCYGSEADAAEAARSFELTTSQLDSRAKYAKPTISERNAFEKAKRDLGWSRLTLYKWRTHPDLKNIRSIMDVSRDTILRLNKEFAGPSYTTALQRQEKKKVTDSARYVRDQAKSLKSRADDYDAKASCLMTHIALGSICELIISKTEPSEEEEELAYSFKHINNDDLASSKTRIDSPSPDSVLSTSQATRLRMQCLLVHHLLQAVADRDRRRSHEYDLKLQAVADKYASTSGNANKRDRKGLQKSETELDALLTECRLDWQSNDTMLQLAERIVHKFTLETGAPSVTARTILSWYNEYLKFGGFLEDMRGSGKMTL